MKATLITVDDLVLTVPLEKTFSASARAAAAEARKRKPNKNEGSRAGQIRAYESALKENGLTPGKGAYDGPNNVKHHFTDEHGTTGMLYSNHIGGPDRKHGAMITAGNHKEGGLVLNVAGATAQEAASSAKNLSGLLHKEGLLKEGQPQEHKLVEHLQKMHDAGDSAAKTFRLGNTASAYHHVASHLVKQGGHKIRLT
jgi:hypothetical protein